ncbi:hypothetical protein Esi_0375_0013 [Ectocarpus siliculosus]|uniref:Uncharacterized protein n=1 Tax=Ectocarpus siliculosus TaxID=2880 RepID=D7FZJ0_ECTSI|nr:hypothetical protein Esi_0375_0013 [Ectocarpus siliculosus]|eukprot:CBJ32797.1 hypothetical protein Esi_0375_0013 [Ectocarpus siliculosus]
MGDHTMKSLDHPSQAALVARHLQLSSSAAMPDNAGKSSIRGGRRTPSKPLAMDRLGASSYSAAVESAGHALSGLAAFSLLPLFHFQLFFFLLESMGGNGFVLCLAWVVVPSVATRVPRLQVLAARHLREMQAIAGGLLAGSLAAGAAGFLTVRLALSAAGLSVAWGFCHAPHWGRGRGAEVMDG